MNIGKQLLLASLVGALTPIPSAFSSPSQGDIGSESKAANSPGSALAASELKLAMPADAVMRLMGKPEAVTPMKAQSGKAEIWIYERQVGDVVEHVQFLTPTTTTLTLSGGKTDTISSGEQVEYRDEHHITTEVTDILMFNDHYVTRKVTRVESVKMFQ